MKRYSLAALAVLLVLLPSQQALQADQALYTIEDLGSTADGFVPTVTGANASGQLSGFVSTPGGSRAVRYTTGHGWEYLPGLNNSVSEVYGINASGDLVGYRFTPEGLIRGFRYSGGLVEDIAPLPGGSFTQGFGINATGDVVGLADANGLIVAFRASVGLPPVALSDLGGGFAVACGINDKGQVAGYSYNAAGIQHAMRVDDTGPTEIGSFDGASGSSFGCAIDANGRVGGQADDQLQPKAFDFAGNGLGHLDSFASSNSMVESIAAGRSVGWFQPAAGGPMRAFTHTDSEGATDLNTAIGTGTGWVLVQAKGVTADGQIVGQGLFNGQPTTFRLTPSVVKDTTPPVFTSFTATPSAIFPPKGQKVTVMVSAVATDDSGLAPVCKLANITGPGFPGVDYDVTGANTASVLAVGGRTYTMNEVCVDAANNAAWASADVTVTPDTTAPVIASLTATPSSVWPPKGQLVPVSVSVTATDDVDDQPVCALSGITSTGGTADDFAIRGTFAAVVRAVGGRTYTLTVGCADAAGNRSASSVPVVVPADTTAPVISDLSATPSVIWPPNGKMVPVQLYVSASDNLDPSPSCTLTSITGASASDSAITGALTASLRALKNNESDRLYMLTVTCSDSAHNKSTRTVSVTVTKDDPAASYNSGHGKGNGTATTGKGK